MDFFLENVAKFLCQSFEINKAKSFLVNEVQNMLYLFQICFQINIQILGD